MKRLTKIQIIEETVNYYKNNKRARDYNGCKYLKDDGSRCAHSRCIKKKVLDKIVKKCNGNSAGWIISEYSDNCHLQKYQGHYPRFWNNIQELHDNSAHWKELENGKNELTSEGLTYVENLIKTYKDDN